MAALSAQTNPDDFIYALAGQESVLFAASSTGLYLSRDGGAWDLATKSLGLNDVVPCTAVVLSPDFEHDHTVVGGMAGGILCSSDGGRAWILAGTPAPPPTITALAVSPNYLEDGVLLAGTMEDGILRSTDCGWHWVSWNFGLLDLAIYSLAISPDFAADDTLFAGTETGIFRSTNGGRAWREVELSVGYDTVLSLAVSPNFKHDRTLYAGTESNGLLISRDGGVNWVQAGLEILDGPINLLLTSGSDLAVLCNGTAWVSRDGGQSWQPLWPELSEEAAITTLFAPHGLAHGAPVWLGLTGGEVKLVNL
jgi:photosystem II stability/assembly factor-like uncharacterized protein